MKFVDEVKIEVSSGRGGPGCVSFRREALVPRGGPDGGDGGCGGDVILRASDRVHSLLDLRFKRKYKAGNGMPGAGKQRTGPDGKDLVITVPRGTVVRGPQGELLVDMEDKDEHLFLKGGIGGKGNVFYKNSANQAPQIAQQGMPGEEKEISLELKLLADVGIIGFPNAGKSTLISSLSAARPKVADYPFTTLVPNLGVVKYGEEASYVVADIPGLIKGASEGVGLGHQFLRHIERTKVFVHLIDGSGLSGRDPLQDFYDINDELKKYDEVKSSLEGYVKLSDRKQLVVLNKVDTLSEQILNETLLPFREKGIEVLPISAVSGLNLRELTYKLGDLVFES